MPTAPAIRPATPEDAAALAAFAAQAFTDTYRDLDDAQEIADYVAMHFQPGVVAGVIGDPACATLLAEVDGQLAGYAIVRDAPPPACVARGRRRWSCGVSTWAGASSASAWAHG